jgi:hypothetical protein
LNDTAVAGHGLAVTMADPWEELEAEAVAIVGAATAKGVTLRVVGSAGIRLHCEAPGPVMDRLGRQAKDIDFIVPQGDRKAMRQLLEGRGYLVDRDLLVAMEGRRYSFDHPHRGIGIDVFVERLDFCHTIEVAGRLHRHPVTLGLEELLLQKIQIVQMTTTDLMDAAALLATHEVGGPGDDEHAASPGTAGARDVGAAGAEVIDAGYIAGLLARDWGFHHTATGNLGRLSGHMSAGTDIDVGEQGIVRIRSGTRRLLDRIEAAPKSLAWRMRARIGERKQWWQDVDEREATY